MSDTHPPVPPAPPAVKAPALQDVSHLPAAPPLAPAPVAAQAVSATAAPLRDVTHTPAQPGPVAARPPMPLNPPVEVQVSPVTTPPMPQKQKVSSIAGIVPETVVGSNDAPAPARPKPAPAVPTAVAPPVAAPEVYGTSTVVGAGAAPVVALAPDAPTVHRDTPYAVADSVRQLAEQNGIDLGTVTPTGKGGRIVKKDVQTAIAAAVLAARNTTTAAAVEAVGIPAAALEAEFVEAVEDTDTSEGPDADVLPFVPMYRPRAVPLTDDDEDDDEEDFSSVTWGVTPPAAVEEVASLPAAADLPWDELTAPAAEVAEVIAPAAPVAPAAPAAEVIVPVAPAAEAPAAPAPVTPVVPAPAPAAPLGDVSYIRADVNFITDRVVNLSSSADLLALAEEKFPELNIVSATVELSAGRPVLVVGFTLSMEVSL